MAKDFEKQEEKLKAMAENQAEAFESVKNGFELTPTNFDENNLQTREGVSQEFMKYQLAASSLAMEANVLESGAMEMQEKFTKFEEEKNEWSWKNAGKFVTGLVTTATFVGPIYDWGAKIFGSNKTLNSRIWQENDDIEKLNKDKEEFVAGLDTMAQKLDAKKKAIDAHGEALNNAVTNTLPANIEAQKQQQIQAVETVVAQAESASGVKLPRDKVEGLKNDLVDRIEKSEGLQVEGLKNNVESGTQEIKLEMDELMLNVAEYPAA
ncbi:hypothetical protein HC823_01180, partial [Candidatus Gracilibacteria bacterium]|nr:hypothetical protein [Candidatus Gracilibacteria bacterium]